MNDQVGDFGRSDGVREDGEIEQLQTYPREPHSGVQYRARVAIRCGRVGSVVKGEQDGRGESSHVNYGEGNES